jgi:hypothetical protein
MADLGEMAAKSTRGDYAGGSMPKSRMLKRLEKR